MSKTVDSFVAKFVSAAKGRPLDTERFADAPSGLDPTQMLQALAHPAVGELGIQLMADFMAPDDSLYYDSIYGAYTGQAAIRRWLVPTMATISFIEFVPTAATEYFDDGAGGTTVDEWQMFAAMGGQKVPLSRGVSVRRYRNGWITWACDVYDTGPFRQPPPAGSDVEAAVLPPYPRVAWPIDVSVAATSVADTDFEADANTFHATDSVYHDPIFGVLRGRAAIRDWLCDVMPRIGNVEFAPVGPKLDNGSALVQEWVQMAVQPDGSRVPMTRGTSVRRRKDGWVTYAADYLDTAPLLDPDVQAASLAAGSTITLEDILKYRVR